MHSQDDDNSNMQHSKCKEKVVPTHAMKTYKRCRGTAPLILKYGTRWSCEERSHQNHFNGMLVGTQSHSGWYGEEKNI